LRAWRAGVPRRHLGLATPLIGRAQAGVGSTSKVNGMVAERPRVYGIRDQGSGIRDQGSGIRDQGSGIRDQGSGIRDQGSGIRDQGSG
jgi:hypothetical protein